MGHNNTAALYLGSVGTKSLGELSALPAFAAETASGNPYPTSGRVIQHIVATLQAIFALQSMEALIKFVKRVSRSYRKVRDKYDFLATLTMKSQNWIQFCSPGRKTGPNNGAFLKLIALICPSCRLGDRHVRSFSLPESAE